ncbi:MAG: AsmA family protein, partial [Chitinophagaceae bacterium]
MVSLCLKKLVSLKKFLKILSIFLLSLLSLLILIAILININFIQNIIINKVTKQLSENLKTRVEIKHVDFRLFDKMMVQGTFVEDHQGDTLLYARQLTVDITDFFFLKHNLVFHHIGLDHAVINLKRSNKNPVWNYQFLINYFSSPAPAKPGAQKIIDLRQVILHQVRINKIDGWAGNNLQVSIGLLSFDTKKFDLRGREIAIPSIELDQPQFILTHYAPSIHQTPDSNQLQTQKKVNIKNAFQWNTDNWKLRIGSLTIKQGLFSMDNNLIPDTSRNFDPTHLQFHQINAALNQINLTGDSITTQLQLSTMEKCGLDIKNLSTQFKISPVEMEFAKLDLETNKSHLKNYFRMKFAHFSDMNDFLNKVSLKANFQHSEVSSDDIAFFDPAMADWKMLFKIKGLVQGPISNLAATGMDIQSGGATRLQGRINMRGLPNINETFIEFHADNLYTSARDLKKFIPSLKKDTQINLAALTQINFKGSFTGFIHDFVAHGNFTTNLGTLQSDINMKTGIHKGETPVYSGNISAGNFDLGTLFKAPYLGKTTFVSRLDGKGFSFNTLKANLNASIANISINGYSYQNIKTNGQFDKKLFTGILLLQDPNASLSFNGSIDFNHPLPVFKFKAEVYNSDLRALKLTSDS